MKTISASEIKQKLHDSFGKNKMSSKTYEKVGQLLSSIVFIKNETCEDNFVLNITNGSNYEPEEACGLSSLLLPTYIGVSECNGIIFIHTDQDGEIELCDIENPNYNLYFLIGDLIEEYGDWNVIVE